MTWPHQRNFFFFSPQNVIQWIISSAVLPKTWKRRHGRCKHCITSSRFLKKERKKCQKKKRKMRERERRPTLWQDRKRRQMTKRRNGKKEDVNGKKETKFSTAPVSSSTMSIPFASAIWWTLPKPESCTRCWRPDVDWGLSANRPSSVPSRTICTQHTHHHQCNIVPTNHFIHSFNHRCNTVAIALSNPPSCVWIRW